MEAPLNTFIVEIDDEFVGSYVIIKDGEFRSYFVDKVEELVDVRVYRVDSDETIQYTLRPPTKDHHHG